MQYISQKANRVIPTISEWENSYLSLMECNAVNGWKSAQCKKSTSWSKGSRCTFWGSKNVRSFHSETFLCSLPLGTSKLTLLLWCTDIALTFYHYRWRQGVQYPPKSIIYCFLFCFFGFCGRWSSLMVFHPQVITDAIRAPIFPVIKTVYRQKQEYAVVERDVRERESFHKSNWFSVVLHCRPTQCWWTKRS